jgi:hypothetical protein
MTFHEVFLGRSRRRFSHLVPFFALSPTGFWRDLTISFANTMNIRLLPPPPPSKDEQTEVNDLKVAPLSVDWSGTSP